MKQMLKIKNNNVVSDTPNKYKTITKLNAEINSTIKYCILIFFVQNLHAPFKNK